MREHFRPIFRGDGIYKHFLSHGVANRLSWSSGSLFCRRRFFFFLEGLLLLFLLVVVVPGYFSGLADGNTRL